jgi:hypothetical protein
MVAKRVEIRGRLRPTENWRSSITEPSGPLMKEVNRVAIYCGKDPELPPCYSGRSPFPPQPLPLPPPPEDPIVWYSE